MPSSVLDPTALATVLTALAGLVTATATLVWSIRRRP